MMGRPYERERRLASAWLASGFGVMLLSVALATVSAAVLAPPIARAAPGATLDAPSLRPYDACRPGAPCRIGDRTYRYQTPPGWDGVTPLPVLVHFHGRHRTARHVLRNRKVAAAAAEHGFILAAPDGVDGNWRFDDAHQRGRADAPEADDVAMLDALIADLARHVQIQRDRVVLSGYSHGAAVVSRIACDRGARYAAYLPIAGHLRGEPPHACADAGAARVMQVHGATDAVYAPPLATDESAHPDYDPADFAFWRTASKCGPMVEERRFHVYVCRFWRGCAPGGEATLCMHRYGHILPKSWLPFALGELTARFDARDALLMAHVFPEE